jgi:hypothetical protein
LDVGDGAIEAYVRMNETAVGEQLKGVHGLSDGTPLQGSHSTLKQSSIIGYFAPTG